MPLNASSDMLSDGWSDMELIGTAPIRWNEREWVAVGGMAGATAGLFTQDVAIAQRMRASNHPSLNTLADVGNALGDGLVGMSVMACLLVFGNDHDQRVGRAGTLAFVEVGLLTTIMKGVTGRLRPSGSPNDAHQWRGPNIGNYAFPSGHMVVATAFSTVLATSYDWGWVFYAVPPLVGWARMYSDVHWASDVFVGACIGWGIAMMQAPRVQSDSPVRVRWTQPDRVEAALVWRF